MPPPPQQPPITFAELKASLETIRSTASDLIKDIDKNFAELTKDKEQAQETPENEPTPEEKQPEQKENTPAADTPQEKKADKEKPAQEEAQAEQPEDNFPTPDPNGEPTVTVIWSEHSRFHDGETMSLSEANALIGSLDAATTKEDGYYKTKFRIDFGRLFCSYLCPAGGLQECTFVINEKNPKQGLRNYIKFAIWSVWLIVVILCYFHNGKIISINFIFETENGISVSSIQSYIIYYGIICLILIPSILFGKRAFCHYLCWMAPFMILGIKLRRFLHLPGIHIRADKKDNCISCGKCNKACPMGIDVMSETKHGIIGCSECIQCGACIDNCPKSVLNYGVIERRENSNGK